MYAVGARDERFCLSAAPSDLPYTGGHLFERVLVATLAVHLSVGQHIALVLAWRVVRFHAASVSRIGVDDKRESLFLVRLMTMDGV